MKEEKPGDDTPPSYIEHPSPHTTSARKNNTERLLKKITYSASAKTNKQAMPTYVFTKNIRRNTRDD